MALIENKITVSGDATGKLLKFLNEHINNFFKQPKWLLMTMFIVICGAVAYFMYTSRSEKECIQNLQEQVNEINDVIIKSLSITDYEENLLKVITEIKLLKQEDQQSYEDELLELSLLIAFIEKYHPNDPIVADLKSMQSRLKTNHDLYKDHFDYIMNQLDEVIEPTNN